MNLSSEIFEHLFTSEFFIPIHFFAGRKTHAFLIQTAQSQMTTIVSNADFLVQIAVFVRLFLTQITKKSKEAEIPFVNQSKNPFK